jgi:hypothetical protein
MLWRVFRRILNDEKLKPMFVIIDGLGMVFSHCLGCSSCLLSTMLIVTDECEEEKRTDLLVKLQDLFDVNHLNFIGKRVKIVITSRPQIPIGSYFPNVVKINLDSNNLNDIANYVHASDLELKKETFRMN